MVLGTASPILPPAFILVQWFHVQVHSPLTLGSPYSYTGIGHGAKEWQHRLKSKQVRKMQIYVFLMARSGFSMI